MILKKPGTPPSMALLTLGTRALKQFRKLLMLQHLTRQKQPTQQPSTPTSPLQLLKHGTPLLMVLFMPGTKP
jgi:hypothetical protein